MAAWHRMCKIVIGSDHYFSLKSNTYFWERFGLGAQTFSEIGLWSQAFCCLSLSRHSVCQVPPPGSCPVITDILLSFIVPLFCLSGTAPWKPPSTPATLELDGSWPTEHRDYLQCYVSAVVDAGNFSVQVLNSRSAQLDTLVQDMTQHYQDATKQVSNSLPTWSPIHSLAQRV